MSKETVQRLKLVIRGAVQGVGFRPFIFRLASELNLTGWVANTTSGVLIEAEGPDPALRTFLLRVASEKPALASIQSLEPIFLDPIGYKAFEITASRGGKTEAWILPDIATCQECRREILDPKDRRSRYPFTNCTHCGPRYSIIESLPYDRHNTSMKKFRMCASCAREYEDPKDRRFHAQPNACPDCGPQFELWDATGAVLKKKDAALRQAVAEVKAGRILALKGLGGFHLIADATNSMAVRTLRERKRRVGKPFALMFPDLDSVKAVCQVSPLEERLLTSPESPIVLLRRRSYGGISDQVAPENPYLGVMLPYSPIHILFMQEVAGPVVATSGNLADETI
jgi:hydrogenase maturation protein HypF